MFYTVLSYLDYDMIYRKVTEMYQILMSLLALLSRPGFFFVWIRNVCILLALPGVPQWCADWRATPTERPFWILNKANSISFCRSVGTRDFDILDILEQADLIFFLCNILSLNCVIQKCIRNQSFEICFRYFILKGLTLFQSLCLRARCFNSTNFLVSVRVYNK